MSRAHEIFAAQVAAAGAPLAATMQVTERCNYACTHCYQVHDSGDDDLTFAEIERIFGELAAAGVLHLCLMGGEFFMRRDADDILRAARAHRFALRVKTTGHFITNWRADLLASLAPIQIDLSLYAADPAMHDEITDQAGSWQRTVRAAEKLLERRVPINLSCPVMEGNLPGLSELQAMAKRWSAPMVISGYIKVEETGDERPAALRMKGESLARYFREPSIAAYDDAYFRHRDEKPVSKSDRACNVGRVVGISPQGKVRPCLSMPGAVGDLRKSSFAQIWASPAFERYRQLTWDNLPVCRTCQLQRYCQRCHADALREHGALDEPLLEACRNAVARRDALRERGAIPASETALPPTWARVDPDGQHHRLGSERSRRSPALRVLSS